MRHSITCFLFFALAFVLTACQAHRYTVRIDPALIPQQTFDVTVHETGSLYYAVLFDIPDDGKRVDLFYTYATNIIGPDTLEAYLDRFANRIRGYRTVQINDRDGNVRGYLMISNLLGYFFTRGPWGKGSSYRLATRMSRSGFSLFGPPHSIEMATIDNTFAHSLCFF